MHMAGEIYFRWLPLPLPPKNHWRFFIPVLHSQQNRFLPVCLMVQKKRVLVRLGQEMTKTFYEFLAKNLI